MRKIWKFPLFETAAHTVDIDLPKGAQIIHFAIQYRGPFGDPAQPRVGVPTIWALVDPDAPMETWRFFVTGTGHPVPDAQHIGSYDAEPFVWHIFGSK